MRNFGLVLAAFLFSAFVFFTEAALKLQPELAAELAHGSWTRLIGVTLWLAMLALGTLGGLLIAEHATR